MVRADAKQPVKLGGREDVEHLLAQVTQDKGALNGSNLLVKRNQDSERPAAHEPDILKIQEDVAPAVLLDQLKQLRSNRLDVDGVQDRIGKANDRDSARVVATPSFHC